MIENKLQSQIKNEGTWWYTLLLHFFFKNIPIPKSLLYWTHNQDDHNHIMIYIFFKFVGDIIIVEIYSTSMRSQT